MMLENEHIKLRAIEPEDLEILYKWENDTNLWIHGSNLSPYSKLTLRQYIIDAQKHDIYEAKQLRLMIISKADESILGTVDLYDFDIRNMRMGVGILIDEKYRRLNYALQSLEIVTDYVFSFLHIHQLYAYISEKNKPSLRLFIKAGFKKCGTLEQWLYCDESYKNVFMYQLINNKNE